MNKENNNTNYPRFIPNKPCGIDKFEGQSQGRLTNAIANHIVSMDNNHTQNLSRIIGLEGGWGVGKSNVIKQLKQHNDIKEKYYLFEYDAWGHQEDLQRRSFLETMTRDLIRDGVLNGKWEQKLNDLLAHKVTRINKTLPKFDAGAFWAALFLALTPITIFLAERLENAKIVECIWYLALIAFAPILFGILLWLILMLFYKEMRSLGWLLQISKNEIHTTKNIETINQKEPSVFDFKNWIHDISNHIGRKNKKLIIVYDNMDRLPADKVKELWSSIHTFFSEKDFDNVWAIIPFDEIHLSCAFGESKEKEQLTKYFISKTFPVVYRVTPPVITDFKRLFNTLFEEAFGNTEDKQKRINSIFRLEKPNATVREIIEFINQLVSLKSIWRNEIDILYLAIFALKKDVILSKSNVAEEILSGDYLGAYIPNIATNDDVLHKNISALVYGVNLDNAEQIPMSKYLDKCFNQEENADINRYAKSDTFIQIIDDKIRNADIAQTDNMINCLSKLDTTIFLDNNLKIISSLWKALTIREKKIPLAKQEFTSTYENLLLHTEKPKDIIKHLCEQIQNFEEFNGKDYYTSLSQIKGFIEKQKIAFDIIAELQEKSVTPKLFLDYVIEAKANYPLFKLTTNQDGLDNYFMNLSPDEDRNQWNQCQKNETNTTTNYSHSYIIEILTNLTRGNVFKFDEFVNKVTEEIPNATANSFKQYFDVYKILSDEKPFDVQLSPTQRQNIWSELASKPNVPEFTEIIAIQIANGANVRVNLNDEQIEYIAKNLDYYANYGDLLINNLSWNIPILNQVLKYMTESCLGDILFLEEVLPKFVEIKNKLEVSESMLLDQFNIWQEHNNNIDSTNIQQIIPKAKFFQFSKNKKNDLTDYLNTVIVEALANIETNQLYEFRQQNINHYWLIVIDCFIDTDFLKSLPENLVEFGKRYLNDIAASRIAIPDTDDFVYKLIEKLDRRKTKETITNIRNQICNNIAGYGIDTNKFLFFHEWFEKQGDLSSRSGDVCQYVLSPVVNNDNCLQVIVENADFYATIINSADEQADTFKNSIKTKLSKDADEVLIAFAKKIGIKKQ